MHVTVARQASCLREDAHQARDVLRLVMSPLYRPRHSPSVMHVSQISRLQCQLHKAGYPYSQFCLISLLALNPICACSLKFNLECTQLLSQFGSMSYLLHDTCTHWLTGGGTVATATHFGTVTSNCKDSRSYKACTISGKQCSLQIEFRNGVGGWVVSIKRNKGTCGVKPTSGACLQQLNIQIWFAHRNCHHCMGCTAQPLKHLWRVCGCGCGGGRHLFDHRFSKSHNGCGLPFGKLLLWPIEGAAPQTAYRYQRTQLGSVCEWLQTIVT